jgi:hypothetical protein
MQQRFGFWCATDGYEVTMGRWEWEGTFARLITIVRSEGRDRWWWTTRG